MWIAFITDAEWSAIWLSLRVATWCVALAAGPGIAIGWLLARKQFIGKPIIDALVHLPLVIPPVAVGFILLLLLGRRGLIGNWLHEAFGIDIAFTMSAAVIASAVMGFPLLVRSVRLGIELVDRRIEVAAATLGASPARVFFTVTLPLALPGVVSGLVLSFARSLGEFGATITFAGNIVGRTQTLPSAIYNYTQVPGGDGPAMRLAAVSLVICFLALLVSEWMSRRLARRMGRRSETDAPGGGTASP
jgi:molybdate transport system permease protein